MNPHTQSVPVIFYELIKILFSKGNDKTKLDTDPNFYDLVYVRYDVAKMLKALDAEEEIVHVEFPGDFNRDEYPQVWLIEAWRTSYSGWIKQKSLAERAREDSHKKQAVIEQLATAINAEYALDDMDAARAMALSFINKKRTFSCTQMGVDISVLEVKSNVIVNGHLDKVDNLITANKDSSGTPLT